MNVEQDRLVRMMSHELRTPMGVIDGSAQFIERKTTELSHNDLQARAWRLRNAVGRMAEIVGKLVGSLDGLGLVTTDALEAQAEAIEMLVSRGANSSESARSLVRCRQPHCYTGTGHHDRAADCSRQCGSIFAG